MVFATVNVLYMIWAQRRKEEHREEILASYASDSIKDSEERAWVDLGDRHPDFKYAIWMFFTQTRSSQS